jgi:hypothetical protein
VNYGFLTADDPGADSLAAALAEMLALPVDAVDVGVEGDDDRRWEAPVSCTVTPLTGDLRLDLDVFLGDTVQNPPPAPVAAVWLAARLKTVVAYQAVPDRPSAYWLVGPDGGRTRARLVEDDDVPGYRIDAVERALPALPGLTVSPLPEVIHEYRMPVPLTDQLRERFPDQQAVLLPFWNWEAMVTRLVEGWPPDGWYPADYYRNDLAMRDELAGLPEAARVTIAVALDEVDRRFAEATVDDGGEALNAATGPAPAGAGWWWRRVSQPLPWQNMP